MNARQRLALRLETHRADRRERLHRTRRASSQTRTRVDDHDVLAFCSNDYLGLSDDPRLATALHEGARRYGTGSGGAHLISGHSEAHDALEEAIAALSGRPRTLLFSSGYQANLAAISAVVQKGDHVLQDRLNHASLLDGAVLAGARLTRYQHNDIGHLAHCLTRDHPVMTICDGVFSMEGDQAPLSQIARACHEHDSLLMVDDAHGFGVVGAQGQGCVATAGLGTEDVPLLTGTLGKAFGTQGAFISGDDDLINALTQFARPYLFTTGLSPALAWASVAAIAIARDEGWRRSHLNALIAYFHARMASLPEASLLPSTTPIQSIVVGDETRVMALADALFERGIMVGAIRPPTVAPGSARLRITLSAAHTMDDIDQLMDHLAVVWPMIMAGTA
ncbi:8-amino-7-oxononanoate synthase [Larsenimonas rhizosphaerae]|uniref:8-amino-7-ketopelargonate synthase n=1 Tax=Larsenimonas rhizosphaerae TaxID=2944682 RepID=A0AA42CT49_9GAMM|nr:8-amino-7-oxononanoate synthase [Larsenimonas rhizosphaerae]MCX2523252.1 8-amino-7-oxononanoate synthase [Larsenimonas rhizosphaerae]